MHETPPPDLGQRLLDEGRVEAAVASRERQRVLEQVQRESATFAGSLLDLAERRAVVVALVAGTSVRGELDLVGADVVRVGGTWLRTAAITTVRVGAGAATGDRQPPDDLTFAGVLERIAEDRPRVVLLVDAGENVRGELVAVGSDVLSVRLDGDGDVAYVPAGRVAGVRTATS